MARKTTRAAQKTRPGSTRLRWFEVENFKSIKKLRLEFKPFMVFVGPNGAGKTNLFQALALALELEFGEQSIVERHGGFDQLVRRGARRAPYIRLAIGAEVDADTYAQRSYESEIRLTPGTGESFVTVKQSTRITPTLHESHLPPSWAIRLRLDASALRGDVAGRFLQGDLLGISGEGLPRALERIHGSPAFRRILVGLKAVYPRIEHVDTVRLLPGEVALRFKERGVKDGLGQANVSDGVMHALALLLVLEASKDDSPLLIEEPENALHPWALRSILERIQHTPRPGPLLLATHSPTLIDAVEDPASLFIVENDDKKGTIVTPALTREKALRAILAESGQKLGEVWLGGLLGGVPEGDA